MSHPKPDSPVAALAGGLLAFYPFHEGSGSLAADFSGFGRDATITGGTWGIGEYGAELAFSASGNLSVPLDLPTTAISFAVGIKSADSSIVLMDGMLQSGSLQGYTVDVSSRRLRLAIRNSTGFSVLASSSSDQITPFGNTSYRHSITTWDGSNRKIYINGEMSTTDTKGGVFTDSLPNPVICLSEFTGSVTYLGIWGRALGDDEVSILTDDPFALVRGTEAHPGTGGSYNPFRKPYVFGV